jgi:hypothetical protein
MKKLYRVLVKTTDSLQPDRSTSWQAEVVYCGYDLDEARRVYHANTPKDYFCGYGNRRRKTVAQSKVCGQKV